MGFWDLLEVLHIPQSSISTHDATCRALFEIFIPFHPVSIFSMAPIRCRHCNSETRTNDEMRPCQCKSILHRECLESFIKGRLANKKSLDVCEVCQTGLKLEDSFWDHFCSVFPMLFSICQVFFMTLGMWRLHTEGAFEGGIDWQVYHRLFEENSLAKCLITLIPPSLLFLYLLWNGW